MVQTKQKTKKSKFFIPKYYTFNIECLGIENYKVVRKEGNIQLYVTPLIRTILENIKSLNLKGQESRTRTIKEKLDSNSRLLLKKGTEKSKIILINGRQYILVNSNIEQIDRFNFIIMNDKQYETSLI